PQSLNRYGATAFGPPGVAETIAEGESPVNLYDIAVDLGALYSGSKVLNLETRLTIRSAQLLSRNRPGWTPPRFAQNLKTRVRGEQVRNAAGQFMWRDELQTVAHPNPRIAAKLTQRLQLHLERGSLTFAGPGRWRLTMGRRWVPLRGKAFTTAGFLEGGGAGFIFDAGWQFVQDWNDPYLTSGQRLFRTGTAGFVGFVAGIGVVALVGTGPVGFLLALPAGWFIEAPISEFIFQQTGNVPVRHLQPLNSS
ncbi:MAG: hypothetical protein ACE5FZ_09120, partial [Nitrospiria bacterium]